MKRGRSLAVLSSSVMACALAQQPRIENARMETRAVAGGLEATLRGIVAAQASPAWIGYAVPIIPGDHQMCCWNNNVMCGCSLEPRGREQTFTVSNNQTVKLEGPTHLVVLYRVEDHRIEKIRTFTPECTLDAGGLPFIWLTGVSAPESIRMLAGIAKDQQLHRVEPAISAIAMHADASADQALEELVSPGEPEQVRRQAVFWLGNARGRRGFEVVSRIVREDASDRVREHAIFALTQSKEPKAMDVIVGVAHNDRSPRVRGQALFWLAQRAAQKVAESAITDAIANDPETEVKKKAVFALTQMPEGEGVPLLIQVVKTNRNPEVRKQAMFWLGQSKDQRALSFIEEVLSSR